MGGAEPVVEEKSRRSCHPLSGYHARFHRRPVVSDVEVEAVEVEAVEVEVEVEAALEFACLASQILGYSALRVHRL